MTHSICLEKLYHIRQHKNFLFLFLTTLSQATPAIFYLHWQLDILKAVLRQKSKAVALVAKCPQYLLHAAKSSIR